MNDRIVSKGRSMRLRVGFERSGSAAETCQCTVSATRVRRSGLTDDISIVILVHDGPQVVHSGMFLRFFGCYGRAMSVLPWRASANQTYLE